MKAKTLAVSTAVLLFMSVAANGRECGKSQGSGSRRETEMGAFPTASARWSSAKLMSTRMRGISLGLFA